MQHELKRHNQDTIIQEEAVQIEQKGSEVEMNTSELV
jgi:hypothetical protein